MKEDKEKKIEDREDDKKIIEKTKRQIQCVIGKKRDRFEAEEFGSWVVTVR